MAISTVGGGSSVDPWVFDGGCLVLAGCDIFGGLRCFRQRSVLNWRSVLYSAGCAIFGGLRCTRWDFALMLLGRYAIKG